MTTEGVPRLGASRKLQEAFERAWPCLCSGQWVANCGFRDTTGIWTSEQLDLASQKVSLWPLGPRLAFSVHWRM